MEPLPIQKLRNQILKRSIDILISLLVIFTILSWFLPLIALLIKLTSKGPVFFIQIRTGKNNKPFPCIKLRSMRINREADLQQAVENDPRITLPGKFLRKFSLDELPQFINVLSGDMSIIGPRPHMLHHTESYSKQVSGYMNRLTVKPGITGLSQVQGYRGEIKNQRMIANRVRLDLFYIQKWSPLLDMSVAAKTVRLMVFGQ
jgi:putative colanic acid biosysnthesis UDP-glucose lipid carrier transferase